jgi:hypothetical protein
MNVEERIAELEGRVQRVLEIASHHAAEHIDAGRDPFIQVNVKGHTHAAAAVAPVAMGVRFAQGTFTGDGTASRRITATDALGTFRTRHVIVKGRGSATSEGAIIFTDTLPVSRPVVLNAVATGISALAADGFDVTYNAGESVRVNQSAVVYDWWALGGSNVVTGSYTGNGTSQSFSGFGDQPIAVFVIREISTVLAVRFRLLPMDTTLTLSNTTAIANAITIDADGFSVGTEATVNQSAVLFHYVALLPTDNAAVGSYVGDGIDDRVLPAIALDFPLLFLQIRGRTGVLPAWRTDGLGAGDTSHTSYQNSATGTNRIQSITRIGGTKFEVGTDGQVNTNTTTYYYLALGDPPLGSNHDPVSLHTDLDANLLAIVGQELDLDTQSANTVFSGPTSGGVAKPSFRALVTADIPGQHTAVTLAADADTLLGLNGQQITLDPQAPKTFLAGPTSGFAADPTFRAIAAVDIAAHVLSEFYISFGSGDVVYQP